MKTYLVECTGDFAYSEHVNTLKEANKVVNHMLNNEAVGVVVTLVRITDTVVRRSVVRHKPSIKRSHR